MPKRHNKSVAAPISHYYRTSQQTMDHFFGENQSNLSQKIIFVVLVAFQEDPAAL